MSLLQPTIITEPIQAIKSNHLKKRLKKVEYTIQKDLLSADYSLVASHASSETHAPVFPSETKASVSSILPNFITDEASKITAYLSKHALVPLKSIDLISNENTFLTAMLDTLFPIEQVSLSFSPFSINNHLIIEDASCIENALSNNSFIQTNMHPMIAPPPSNYEMVSDFNLNDNLNISSLNENVFEDFNFHDNFGFSPVPDNSFYESITTTLFETLSFITSKESASNFMVGILNFYAFYGLTPYHAEHPYVNTAIKGATFTAITIYTKPFLLNLVAEPFYDTIKSWWSGLLFDSPADIPESMNSSLMEKVYESIAEITPKTDGEIISSGIYSGLSKAIRDTACNAIGNNFVCRILNSMPVGNLVKNTLKNALGEDLLKTQVDYIDLDAGYNVFHTDTLEESFNTLPNAF